MLRCGWCTPLPSFRPQSPSGVPLRPVAGDPLFWEQRAAAPKRCSLPNRPREAVNGFLQRVTTRETFLCSSIYGYGFKYTMSITAENREQELTQRALFPCVTSASFFLCGETGTNTNNVIRYGYSLIYSKHHPFFERDIVSKIKKQKTY